MVWVLGVGVITPVFADEYTVFTVPAEVELSDYNILEFIWCNYPEADIKTLSAAIGTEDW